MFHAIESWPLTKPCMAVVFRAPCSMPVKLDRAMISHICNIKPVDMATVSVRSRELLAKLKLKVLDLIVREKDMWSVLVVQSEQGPTDADDAPAPAC